MELDVRITDLSIQQGLLANNKARILPASYRAQRRREVKHLGDLRLAHGRLSRILVRARTIKDFKDIMDVWPSRSLRRSKTSRWQTSRLACS